MLPGERSLSLLLQVSRPTMKAALDILRHDGVIEVRSRKSPRILQAALSVHSQKRRTVVILTGKRLHQHAVNVLSFIGKLQQTLSNGDFHLTIVDDPFLSQKKPGKFLEKVITDHNAVCYLLISVSEPVQTFLSKARLPAIVCGSLFPSVHLPSCDWNYPAMGRHAAGVFLSKGHQELCVVRPSIMKKGDWDGEAGFKSVVERHKGADLTVISNNGEAKALYSSVQNIFRGKGRPTAIFAPDPYDCITVLFALENLRLKVPEAVSIISIDWANIFRPFPFRVASYSDSSRFVEKSAKLVLKLAYNHVLPPKETLVMADFESGDTIARPGLTVEKISR